MTFPVKYFGKSANSCSNSRGADKQALVSSSKNTRMIFSLESEDLKEFLRTSRELAAESWPSGSSARWLGRSNGQLHRPVGSPLQDEVLILFPGSGNASRGQGPPERERKRAAHWGAGPAL